VLIAYAWPGNITDLAQVVGKIASSTDVRVVGVDKLPLRIKDLSGWPDLAGYLALQEKHYIEQVLHACRGNKEQAARILGVDLARLG
jgi:two-component system response regulator HydG/two-component system response regulator AtoC